MRNPGEYYKLEEALFLDEMERIFRIVVLEANTETKEIKVRLEVGRREKWLKKSCQLEFSF